MRVNQQKERGLLCGNRNSPGWNKKFSEDIIPQREENVKGKWLEQVERLIDAYNSGACDLQAFAECVGLAYDLYQQKMDEIAEIKMETKNGAAIQSTKRGRPSKAVLQ